MVWCGVMLCGVVCRVVVVIVVVAVVVVVVVGSCSCNVM